MGQMNLCHPIADILVWNVETITQSSAEKLD